MYRTSSRSGFTLVELLVVIAIIGVLVALLLPAVQAAREAARRSSCSNNLKQLAIGCHNYHDTTQSFPLSYGFTPPSRQHWADPVNSTHRSTSWMVQVLPFVEQKPLYDMIDFNWDVRLDPRNGTNVNNPNNPSNAFVARTVIPTYRCPSDGLTENGRLGTRANRNAVPRPTWAVNNYKGVCGSNWGWGNFQTITPPRNSPLINFNVTLWSNNHRDGLDAGNGIFYRGGRADINRQCATPISQVTDGTSNTLMIGEAVPRWCTHTWWWWFNGTTATTAVPLNVKAQHPNCQTGNRTTDLNCAWGDWPNNYSFMSQHPGGANFALADGSTRFVAQTIDLTIYRCLGTKGNGESAQIPN